MPVRSGRRASRRRFRVGSAGSGEAAISEEGEPVVAAGSEGLSPAAGPREALSIAIASGKGGTGKSFLATNLALVAARRACRCTLVDADYGLAADHYLLGVTPRRTLQDLIEGRAPAALLRTPGPLGLELIAGATGVPELAGLGRAELLQMAHALGEWARDRDLLILDTGAGIQMQVIVTLLAADVVVLVVQPEIASLTDAYAVTKCLARRPGPRPRIGVVVNRAHDAAVAEAAFERLADVAQRFLGLPLHDFGFVHDEPAVTPRRLGQPPLVLTHPECRTALEIGAILDRIGQVTQGLGPRPVRTPQQGITARMVEQLPRPA